LLAVLLLLAPAAAETTRAQAVERVARAVLHRSAAVPPFTLAVCAVMHNEGFHLREWVLYHLLVGVQHFYLYDNDSNDNTREALQPFTERGIVTYIPWPGEKGAAQGRQLSHCFNASAPTQPAKWMAGFDIDEFLVVLGQPVSDAPLLGEEPFVLHTMLTQFQRAMEGAIMLDRMIFDTSGHAERPAGLAIRAYTSRLLQLRPPKHVVGKPLVFMEALQALAGAHEVVMKPSWAVVTADHAVWSVSTQHHTYEPLRLNHLSSRSFAECMAKANDVVRRQSSNWRRQMGQGLCDKMMPGTAAYHTEEHGPDTALSSSLFPDVISSMLAQLQPSS
jgi:hypothetical protein